MLCIPKPPVRWEVIIRRSNFVQECTEKHPPDKCLSNQTNVGPTWPHLVIRGAIGGLRHIGHVEFPSVIAEDGCNEASAEMRGTKIWMISDHWK